MQDQVDKIEEENYLLYKEGLRDSFSLPPSLKGVSRYDLILYIKYLEHKMYNNDIPINNR